MRVPQIHLKNRELENTKLSAELQMLKSVDVNKENIIAQFKEEAVRLQTCLMEKEKQYREVLAKVSPVVRKIPFLASEQHHNEPAHSLSRSAVLSVTVLARRSVNLSRRVFVVGRGTTKR